MRVLWTALAALAVVAASAPAAARRPVEPRATRMVHDLARCLFLSDPNRVRHLLTLDSRDPAYASTFQHLVERNACLNFGTIGASGRIFKGALAEFMVLQDLHGDPLAAHVAYDPSRPPIRTADEAEIMSLCVVRAVPGEVEALFQTEPSGTTELEALRAIAPALPGCLRRGARAELDRSTLRAMLASAAFRLTSLSDDAAAAVNGSVDR
jgi:hypothetical protein